jgi:hypothetical protein
MFGEGFHTQTVKPFTLLFLEKEYTAYNTLRGTALWVIHAKRHTFSPLPRKNSLVVCSFS